MGTPGPDPAIQSGKFHTKNNCSHITPENATTGTLQFPVCADCARVVETQLISAMLIEMIRLIEEDDWAREIHSPKYPGATSKARARSMWERRTYSPDP